MRDRWSFQPLMKGETGTSSELIATHYSHRSEGPGTHRGRIVDKRSINGDERALFLSFEVFCLFSRRFRFVLPKLNGIFHSGTGL